MSSDGKIDQERDIAEVECPSPLQEIKYDVFAFDGIRVSAWSHLGARLVTVCARRNLEVYRGKFDFITLVSDPVGESGIVMVLPVLRSKDGSTVRNWFSSSWSFVRIALNEEARRSVGAVGHLCPIAEGCIIGGRGFI